MSIKQDMSYNVLWHHSSSGPIFGDDYDLFIISDANNNSDSYSYLGNTYEIPPGQTDTFLVGSNIFKVSEIEVFQVI